MISFKDQLLAAISSDQENDLRRANRNDKNVRLGEDLIHEIQQGTLITILMDGLEQAQEQALEQFELAEGEHQRLECQVQIKAIRLVPAILAAIIERGAASSRELEQQRQASEQQFVD